MDWDIKDCLYCGWRGREWSTIQEGDIESIMQADEEGGGLRDDYSELIGAPCCPECRSPTDGHNWEC